MSGTAAAETKIAQYITSLQDANPRGTPQSIEAEIVHGYASRTGEAHATTADETTLFGLLELLLKDQKRFDIISGDRNVQRELVPRLLTIGLIGYVVFGAALSIIFSAAGIWPELASVTQWLETGEQPLIRFVSFDSGAWQKWFDGSAPALIAAFACGLLGANGICLPSFYFYNLLSGVRTTLLQVTVIALKGMAAGAIAVVGALPIYFATVLGLLVIPAPKGLVDVVCAIGLLLPFIAGFWGTISLYRGFVALASTMPIDCRDQRSRFLRRLVFAWSACFTAVTPLMIFTLWEYLGH